MRFFRHGDVLAITLPESMRKKLGISEGDEFDFVEVKPGVMALAAKGTTPSDLKGAVSGSFKPSVVLENPLSLGFKVLTNELDAKSFSGRHEAAIKSGQIKGVRGFDKKFYLCSRAYFDVHAPRLLSILTEEKNTESITLALKLSPDAVLTLLYVLKDEGEIIEKKRGVFARVL
jgi:hypothetical protein